VNVLRLKQYNNRKVNGYDTAKTPTLRQPVLGSIPRTGAPEIENKIEVWHINLLRCTRRVIRAVVQNASLFKLTCFV
jgi:hypothetical protein